MPFIPEWEFSIKRSNKGYLVYGIFMLLIGMVLTIRMFVEGYEHWLYFLSSSILLSLSILFIVLYVVLPRDIITIRRDTLYLIKGGKKLEIPFSRIVAVSLVYGGRFGIPILSHLTIRYRDAMSYSRIRILKLKTISWSEDDIAEVYRYLNLFSERYKYEVKVIRTMFTFMH